LYAIPAATNPALDTTGAHCAEGQAGPVWFLAGTFGGDPVTSHCIVSAGKALFFPLATVLFGAGVLACEPTGPGPCNLVTWRVDTSAVVDAVQLNASIDGKPLGFDHGVGHPLLLLYDAKAPNCRKNKVFKDLGYYSE